MARRDPRGDRPGDIDHKTATRVARAASASLASRKKPKAGLLNRLAGAATKPLVDTYEGVAQLAGVKQPRQTALRRGAYEKAPKVAARVAYEASPLKPYLDFATKPSVGRAAMALLSSPVVGAGAGAAPAVAITTKSKELRKALGLGNSMKEAKAAKKWAEYADLPRAPLKKDIRSRLKEFVEEVPVESEYGTFVDDRTAIIQDPRTGKMYSAPGVLHGDLIEHVARKQGRHPDYEDWLQHEVYGPHQGYSRPSTGGPQEIPPRLMWHGGGAVPYSSGRDSELATIARAKLLKQLDEAGLVDDLPEEARRRALLLKERTSPAQRARGGRMQQDIHKPRMPHRRSRAGIREDLANSGFVAKTPAPKLPPHRLPKALGGTRKLAHLWAEELRNRTGRP